MRQGLQWYALLVAGVVALVLMFVGMMIVVGPATAWIDRAVDAAGLTFRAATFRYLAPDDASDPALLTAGRALWVITVAFVATKATLLALRKDLRLVRAQFARGHVVVCGLAQSGEAIAERLRGDGHRVTAVDLDPDRASVKRLERHGQTVVIGDARDGAVLEAAGVARARAVVATCRSAATNIEISMAARALARQKRPHHLPPLRAVAQVSRSDLREHLTLYDNLVDREEGFEFRTLDVASVVARALFRDYLPIAPAVGQPNAPRHLVVIGFGAIGEAVVEQAMRTCQFADERRPVITVLSATAQEHERAFRARFPLVDQVCDLRFRTTETASAALREADLFHELDAAAGLAGIVIALDDDDGSIAAGLSVRDALVQGRTSTALVYIHLSGNARLGALVTAEDDDRIRESGLRVFGGETYVPGAEIVLDDATDALARAFHDHYRAPTETLSETHRPADLAWQQLPEFYRQSSRRQADHVAFRLRAMGMTLVGGPVTEPVSLSDEEVEIAARMEHRRWCAERFLAGWQFGAAREDAARRHPWLVDWADLPEDARRANRDAARALPEIIAAAGLSIRRDAESPTPERSEMAVDVAHA